MAGLCFLAAPTWAPWLVILGLIGAAETVLRGWHAARGTALRGVVAWAGVGIALGVATEWIGLGEAATTGRPLAGRLAYLTTLAALAACLSVLNARRPGNGAWSVLMGVLILVFLIPWLEGAGLTGSGASRRGLRLEAPWSLFFLLLGATGVSNFLPTRYGAAACTLGAMFLVEYAGLTHREWPPERRGLFWMLVPWCLAAVILIAEWRAPRSSRGRSGEERLWFWFRDHWGVVWGLRVQERFQESAKARAWPLSLSWHGFEGLDAFPAGLGKEREQEFRAMFRTLFRRFADPERIERESLETPHSWKT